MLENMIKTKKNARTIKKIQTKIFISKLESRKS